MIIVAAGRGLFSMGLMLRNAQRPSAAPRLHGALSWWDVAGAMIKPLIGFVRQGLPAS